MEDDDLYGDLDISHEVNRLKDLESRLKTSETLRRSLEQRVADLQRRENALKEQNEVLARNISCLFNTAKTEINRKDSMIAQQRKQLEELQFSKGKCGRLG
ncbi:unnamed protein product [Discosporangium mesarthrocarpum]